MSFGKIAHLLKTSLLEVRSNLKHFRILLLCLFLGVFVIGLVQSFTLSIEEGLRKEGKSILGGDFSIRQIYEPISDEALKAIKQFGRVATSIEMRGLVRNKAIEKTALSEIKAVDQLYPLFGSFELKQAGQVIPNAYLSKFDEPSIILEQALVERLELEIGDAVSIGSKDFILQDVIKSEPDRTGGSTFSVGPRAMVTKSAIQDTGLILPGAQVYYSYKVGLNNPDYMDVIVKNVKAMFQNSGARVLSYTNASPRIQSFLDRLSLFFTLVGLSALLIGGVGIGNAVRVVLEKRMTSLAVMKAVGASNNFVFSLWLVTLIISALLAIIPAVAIAFGLPFVFENSLKEILPVPVVAVLDPIGIGLTAFFGMMILLIFSWAPLGQAINTKPALLLRQGSGARVSSKISKKSMFFVGLLALLLSYVLVVALGYPLITGLFLVGAFGVYLILKVLGWLAIKGLALFSNTKNLAFKMAVLQMIREKRQTYIVLLSLGLALSLFSSIALIENNILNRLNRDIPKDAPAFFFIDIQKSQMADFEAMLNSVDGVSNLNKVPNLRGRILKVNGVDAQEALIDESESWLLRGDRGFTYLKDKPDYSELIEGEWWTSDYQGDPIVSVVEDVAQAFGVGVGDTLTLSVLGREVEAEIASVRTVDWSTMTINYAITFAPGYLENAPHSYLATIQAPRDQETKIMNEVGKAFPNVTAIQVRDALEMASDILVKIGLAMRGIAGLALITGLLVLIAALLSTMRQRRYDHVIMKVLGAPRNLLTKTVLIEFALLGIIATGVALVAGAFASYFVIEQTMNIEWHWNAKVAFTVLAIAMTSVLGFAVIALWRLFQVRSADYLRNE